MAESATTNIFTDMRDASTQSYEASNKAFVDFFRSDNKMERMGDALKAYAPSLKSAATSFAKVATTPFALVGAAYDVYAAPHVQPRLDAIKSKADAGLGAASAFIGARVNGARNFVNNVRAAIDENRGISAISKNTGLHKDEIEAGLAGQSMHDYYAEQWMKDQLNNPTQGFAGARHQSRQEYIDDKIGKLAKYHKVSPSEYAKTCDDTIEQSLESVGLHAGDSAASYVGKRDWLQSKGFEGLTLDDTITPRVEDDRDRKIGTKWDIENESGHRGAGEAGRSAGAPGVGGAAAGAVLGGSVGGPIGAVIGSRAGQATAKTIEDTDIEAAMASAADTVSSTAQRIADKVTPVEQDKSEQKLDTEMNF